MSLLMKGTNHLPLRYVEIGVGTTETTPTPTVLQFPKFRIAQSPKTPVNENFECAIDNSHV